MRTPFPVLSLALLPVLPLPGCAGAPEIVTIVPAVDAPARLVYRCSETTTTASPLGEETESESATHEVSIIPREDGYHVRMSVDGTPQPFTVRFPAWESGNIEVIPDDPGDRGRRAAREKAAALAAACTFAPLPRKAWTVGKKETAPSFLPALPFRGDLGPVAMEITFTLLGVEAVEGRQAGRFLFTGDVAVAHLREHPDIPITGTYRNEQWYDLATGLLLKGKVSCRLQGTAPGEGTVVFTANAEKSLDLPASTLPE